MGGFSCASRCPASLTFRDSPALFFHIKLPLAIQEAAEEARAVAKAAFEEARAALEAATAALEGAQAALARDCAQEAATRIGRGGC